MKPGVVIISWALMAFRGVRRCRARAASAMSRDNTALANEIVATIGDGRQLHDCIRTLGAVLTSVLAQVPDHARMACADAFCRTLIQNVRETMT
jgi:hypothetical protein